MRSSNFFLRKLLRQLMVDRGHLRLRSRNAHTFPQPPVAMHGMQVARCGVSGICHPKRNKNVGMLPWRNKTFGHHANHGVRIPVEGDRLADGMRIASEITSDRK